MKITKLIPLTGEIYRTREFLLSKLQAQLVAGRRAPDDTFAEAAFRGPGEALEALSASREGLTDDEAKARLDEYGFNEVAHEKPSPWYVQLPLAFKNPFIILLIGLAAVSWLTGDAKATVIISTMVVISGALRFFQEFRSSQAAEKLKAMVSATATVSRKASSWEAAAELVKEVGVTPHPRETSRREMPIKLLVPGDIVHLAAGDMVPADVRLLTSKDLFVSQAALTGEALPVEKYELSELGSGKCAMWQTDDQANPLESPNLCFMGTNVVSGTATAVVVKTGSRAYFGSLAGSVSGQRALTSFDKGVSEISWSLIRFMAAMTLIVFLVNGLTKGDWTGAFFFGLAVAVGLTPEMLPVIVTANLARGALKMSRRKVVVKNLNAIQNLGAMDVLCTDKTGTLTRDKIILERHLDIHGETKEEVLRYAYLNSFYQTGLKNLLDVSVLEHGELRHQLKLEEDYRKVDEIPFDFARRRMTVIVEQERRQRLLICKGAVEELLSVCSEAERDGDVVPLDDAMRRQAKAITRGMNEEGMRVLAVAYKKMAEPKFPYSAADESDLTLAGFLAFFDPPKETAAEAILALAQHGVEVKVLTGDNEVVARKICREVGIEVKQAVLGRELERKSDEELEELAGRTTIFAKLSPTQKARVIKALQRREHTVGFLGDGINDAPALREADVGVSVDTAVDIAKESADIILLEKSLLALDEGVIEGRRTFGNIIKYIKMSASSNFGNMFSVLGASAFLPFLPMLPLQLLAQNLLYDLSQTAIPFDNMDPEYLASPRKWEARDIGRFMFFIGPISSLFDFTTFALMWFVFGANAPERQALFQSGWFVEGLLSQTLIVHMIRTTKLPFIQSAAAQPLLLLTVTIMAVGVCIPFSPLAGYLWISSLPSVYFFWLVGMLLAYSALTQAIKVLYIRKFRRWL
ncbi:MAG: magnesium-translocating P-type ATPase [Chloracidobacterium sp.]|nr:magnesium-translocating P-type ATPase [Chloracidobacterium sp.]